jgi:hypothetical protein
MFKQSLVMTPDNDDLMKLNLALKNTNTNQYFFVLKPGSSHVRAWTEETCCCLSA